MAGRFGERTRVTEAVSGFGQRSSAGGGGTVKQPYEEVFTAPGTWTKPASVTRVDVLLVGGGGGGGGANGYTQSPTSPASPGVAQRTGNFGGGGGGGGVRLVEGHPVTTPVPVTVGAGGTAGPATLPTVGGVGGTTSFGPLSVGGGGGGGGITPVTQPGLAGGSPTSPGETFLYRPEMNGGNAPADGGGGGGTAWFAIARPGFPAPTSMVGVGLAGTGGTYGSPAVNGTNYFPTSYGGSPGGGAGRAFAVFGPTVDFTSSATGFLGYGTGGTAQGIGLRRRSYGPGSYSGSPPTGTAGTAGLANTGAGGDGGGIANANPVGVAGGAGGSGIVIVRYWQ